MPRRNANGHERMTPARALALAQLALEYWIETDADQVIVAELREARGVIEAWVKPVFEKERNQSEQQETFD